MKSVLPVPASEALDKFVDVVLNYRPASKVKQARKRKISKKPKRRGIIYLTTVKG